MIVATAFNAAAVPFANAFAIANDCDPLFPIARVVTER